MKQKTFLRILLAVTAVCLLLTICHLVYCVYAYQHCSIIYFIGEELW